MTLKDLIRLLYENQWTNGLLKVVLKYRIKYRTVIDRTPIYGELENLRHMKVDELSERGSWN
jgi:hypothetical protein